jgi:microcystin-dependent protein
MEPFLGEIRITSLPFAPTGWAFCNGQILQINTNQALYSLLGKMYGGDGINNFALPDLRGKAALSISPAYTQGVVGGAATTTVTVNQMPAHNHQLNVYNQVGSKITPADNYFADTATGDNDYGTTVDTTLNIGTIESAGGGQPVSIMQPYLALSFMIAVQGIYPPRQ